MRQPWPQVGQVWEDTDPRMKGRTLKVVSLRPAHVTVEVLTDRETAIKPTVGREYDLAVSRMVGGEYRLLDTTEQVADRSGEEV